jgi:hypothetical protein
MNTSMISSRLNVHNIFHKIALRQGTFKNKVKPKKIMMMSLIKIVCMHMLSSRVCSPSVLLNKENILASGDSTSYV